MERKKEMVLFLAAVSGSLETQHAPSDERDTLHIGGRNEIKYPLDMKIHRGFLLLVH